MKKRESSRITEGKMKKIFRMYKAKKSWLIAPVVIAAMGVGLALAPVTSLSANGEDAVALADETAEELAAAKTKAIADVDKLTNLTDTQKDSYKSEINKATTIAGVNDVVKAATEVNLKAAKEKATAEINATTGVTNEAKNTALKAVEDATNTAGVSAALNVFRNATNAIQDAKFDAKAAIDKLEHLSDTLKSQFKEEIDLVAISTTAQIDQIVADAKLEDARTAAIAEVTAATYLTQDEKDGYTSLLKSASSIDRINQILDQAKDLMSDLMKAQVAAIAEIDKLENLSDEEKAAKVEAVQNAANTDEVATALEAAKTLDTLNAAKADALKEIKDADYLTAAQKTKYTDAVNDAKDLEALNKILDEIRELAPVTAVAVYRAYNPNDGDHLYTTSEKEYKDVIAAGWSDEEIAWYSASKGDPVYRLYNPNSGEHFYTTSEKEYNDTAAAGWTKEDIAFYSDTEKAVAIHRVFNPNATGPGSHHFTKSTKERDELIGFGWEDEKIGFYGVEAPK